MKKIILMLLVMTISGCANHPYRTGKIVVEPFDITSFETNNPMQVKRDVAEKLSLDLQKAIIKHISRDSKLTAVNDCSIGDYVLSGRFEKIDSSIDSHWRVVTITVNQKFDVDLDGKLKDCKTGKEIVTFGPSKDGENMSSIINHLGVKIVNYIKKDKAVSPGAGT